LCTLLYYSLFFGAHQENLTTRLWFKASVKSAFLMMTRRCLNGTAPQYLAAHCVPVSATASRQHLCSAASHQLVVPSYRLSSYGRRSFSVAGPATWNSLRRHLHDPVHTIPVFGRLVYSRHFSSHSTSAYSALGAVLALMRYISRRFTYLLTYLLTFCQHSL